MSSRWKSACELIDGDNENSLLEYLQNVNMECVFISIKVQTVLFQSNEVLLLNMPGEVSLTNVPEVL